MQQVYEFLDVDATQLPDVLDTEFYRTAQRPTYPPVVVWARRLATRHMVQAKFVRSFAETVLAHRPDGDLRGTAGDSSQSSNDHQLLAPRLRAQLVDLLRDDVARLRRYMPADFDGWGYS